jgi:hypothetical protein
MTEAHSEKRLGKFTASSMAKLIKTGRSKADYFGETALTYIEEKVCEILNGEPAPQVSTWATEYGLNKEADAIMWFTTITGKQVTHYGANEAVFFEYDENSGASPDAMCKDESSIVQAKCPANSQNHSYLLRAPIDPVGRLEFIKKNETDYYIQCQFEMMATKTDKCYLVFYDDRRVDPKHRMAMFELPIDTEMVELLKERLGKAVELLRQSVKQLMDMPDVTAYQPTNVTIHDQLNDQPVTTYDTI